MGNRDSVLPRRRFMLLALTLACQMVHGADADRPSEVAPQLAAAYLYKFASFVEWPTDTLAAADSPIVVGVMGADSFAAELSASLTSHPLNGRHFQVRRLAPGDNLAGVHILFLGRLTRRQLQAEFAKSAGQPVLTVTDSDEGFALGSAINLVLVNERLRFEVAPAAANQGRLKLSALMLSAAYRVVKGAS